MEGTNQASDLKLLKTRMYATWTAGDFSEIARSFEKGAAEFAGRLPLHEGVRVLDVACGDGNTAIPAAKKGASVTGIDLAPYLIDAAKRRAAEAGVEANFEVGDAEAMPHENGEFDVVVSMFGAMFAPRQEVAADELLRVCRSGGLIAMANWTAEGFVGRMFRETAKFVPPPAGLRSPILWGSEAAVSERFAGGVLQLDLVRRNIEFVFPFGPAETVEHFRKFYGPTQKAFAALDESGQAELRARLEELWAAHNTGAEGTTVVSSEYLEVLAVKS